jgi:hypothetical protein
MTYKYILDLFTKQPLQNQILRVSDMACIPFDEANTDYQAYLKWLDGYEFQITGPMQMDWVKTAESNTPLPADNV